MSGNNLPTVVFINHWAHPGGAEYSLCDILTTMAARAQCHLITTEEGWLVTQANRNGISTTIIPCSSKLKTLRRQNLLASAITSPLSILSFLRYVLNVRRLINQLDPDVIHANVPKSHITAFLLRLLGYKGEICIHLREIFTCNSAVFHLYRFACPVHNTKILAISHAVLESLHSSLQKRTIVIHNGVTISGNTPVTNISGPIKFVYLGRIVPWKGCHTLIEIFSQVRHALPNVSLELSLIGDTRYWSQTYREYCIQCIKKLGLESCCFLKSHIDNILEELPRHHVFCTASKNEPFGRSIVEAQGCGLPVIAYDTGGISEIVETEVTGILAPYEDVRSFASAMVRFITDPHLISTMGNAGHQRSSRFFNKALQIPAICDFILSYQ